MVFCHQNFSDWVRQAAIAADSGYAKKVKDSPGMTAFSIMARRFYF
jgi:hypothetical protein